MDKLLELIEVLPNDLRAVDQLGLSNDRVGTVVRAFYASLFSTVTSQFERLQDPTLRETMRSGISEQIAAAHAKVSNLYVLVIDCITTIINEIFIIILYMYNYIVYVHTIYHVFCNLYTLLLYTTQYYTKYRCMSSSLRRAMATTPPSYPTQCRKCECC